MLFIAGFSAYLFFNQNLFSPKADQVANYNLPNGYATQVVIPGTPSNTYSYPGYIRPPGSPTPTPILIDCSYHFNNVAPAICIPTPTPSTQAPATPSPSPTGTILPIRESSPSPSPTIDCRYVNNYLPSDCPVIRPSASPTPSSTTNTSPSPTTGISPSPATSASPSCEYRLLDDQSGQTVRAARPWWAVFWWWPRQPTPNPSCPVSQLTPTPRVTSVPTDFPSIPPTDGCEDTVSTNTSTVRQSWFQSIFSFFTRIFRGGDYPVGRCPSPSPSPRTTPTPEPTESTPTEEEPTDSITFTINLGPTRNSEIVFDGTHRAKLFIYDNDREARTVSASSASKAKQNTDGTWSVTFKARDIRRSATTIATGNYCVEFNYRFDSNGRTYASGYRANTYTTHSDREMLGGELGVFLYTSGTGDKRVNGLEFNEPTPQRRVFCPTN
jgi:hypothetical protein